MRIKKLQINIQIHWNQIWYNKSTIDWLRMRGLAALSLVGSLRWETSRGGRCLPMDIVSALTLMISFGMLVAFIVSDHNHKK